MSHFLPEIKFELLDKLEACLKKIFRSNTYRYSREQDNLRMMPEFMNPQSLRIFAKSDNRDLTEVHEEYKTISYDFEKYNNTHLEKKGSIINKDFAMIYVTPQITGRYRLYANILYTLEYEFASMQKVSDFINIHNEEYDGLIKGVIDGFRKHHTLEAQDEDFLLDERDRGTNDPVDLIQMELFFVLLEAIDEKLERLIEVKEFRTEEFTMLQTMNRTQFGATGITAETAATSNAGTSNAAHITEGFDVQRKTMNDNIDKFKRLEGQVTGQISLLIEKSLKIELCPTIDEILVLKGDKKKIPRDRYFKPLFAHKNDHDLFQDRYRKNMTKYVDIMKTPYRTAEFFQNPDKNQERWLSPPDLYVYDIKKPADRKVKDLYVDPLIINGELAEKELIRAEIAKNVSFKTIKK